MPLNPLRPPLRPTPAPGVAPLAGWLGEGATYRGALKIAGRVRIDGHLIGQLTTNDLVEIGPRGCVEGDLDAAQALVYGHLDGEATVHERCTLMATARVRGRLSTPWLDARPGCALEATLIVMRGGSRE